MIQSRQAVLVLAATDHAQNGRLHLVDGKPEAYGLFCNLNPSQPT